MEGRRKEKATSIPSVVKSPRASADVRWGLGAASRIDLARPGSGDPELQWGGLTTDNERKKEANSPRSPFCVKRKPS